MLTGHRKKVPKKEWIMPEILNIMEERKHAKVQLNTPEYL